MRATAGAVPAVPGYLKRIGAICDRHGVLPILDEIICGMGRTGYLFACQEDGVAPDILTIAKGLGAGYQPVGAMLCTAAIHDTFAAGSGFFQHGHTCIGHPAAMAAADAVLTKLTAPGMMASVRANGAALTRARAGPPKKGPVSPRTGPRGTASLVSGGTRRCVPPKLRCRGKRAMLSPSVVWIRGLKASARRATCRGDTIDRP